ncbi:hypothetical protein ABT282_05085 [Streptomyces sp. NPDC000927]|uniref:hypothetical protein n=1 Tax=Streptomyces sp. NPDC000927 TaxID=3154371 RepID=UPI00331857BC
MSGPRVTVPASSVARHGGPRPARRRAGAGRSVCGTSRATDANGRERTDALADRLDALTTALARIAAPPHARYGVRVITDGIPRARSAVRRRARALLAAEDRAARTDPGRRLVGPVRLCGVRS